MDDPINKKLTEEIVLGFAACQAAGFQPSKLTITKAQPDGGYVSFDYTLKRVKAAPVSPVSSGKH